MQQPEMLLCTWGCFLLRSQIFDQEQGYWTHVTFSFYHKFLQIVVCFFLWGTAVDITTDLQRSGDSLLVKRYLIKESLMPPNREKYRKRELFTLFHWKDLTFMVQIPFPTQKRFKFTTPPALLGELRYKSWK